MKIIPEFSVIIKLSDLEKSSGSGKITADKGQKERLANRFGLPEISMLEADYQLENDRGRISFSGKLQSRLRQICAISGEEFPVEVEEDFQINFVGKYQSPGEDEVELASEQCDEIEYDGARIDLGEALAQTLYLALDPYPRGPNAAQVAEEKGLKTEEQAGPFGALAALKK